MREALGRRLLELLEGRGARERDVEALCQALAGGALPGLNWRPQEDMLSEVNVDPKAISVRLHNALLSYWITALSALQLFSRKELEGLWDMGSKMVSELVAYLYLQALELREDEPIAVRAANLGGTILEAPVVVALLIVFNKRVCLQDDHERIRSAVIATGTRTIGGLVGILARYPEIPGIASQERARLSRWLAANIFQ